MSHSWYCCPDCGDDVPDCDCCESDRPHDEECVPTHDVRYRESMGAMSRFLVFVWMEAEAQHGHKNGWWCEDEGRWLSLREALHDKVIKVTW